MLRLIFATTSHRVYHEFCELNKQWEVANFASWFFNPAKKIQVTARFTLFWQR